VARDDRLQGQKGGKSKREEIREIRRERMQGDAETIMGQIPQLVDDDDEIDPQMETSMTALEGERPRLRVRIKKYKISLPLLPPQRSGLLLLALRRCSHLANSRRVHPEQVACNCGVAMGRARRQLRHLQNAV
jgi:hypothetical protein